MNSGGNGGGQNRPWQGGGNGPGRPNPNYRGNNYNPYYNNNSNWNRGYNNWRPTNYQQKSSNQQIASDPGQAGQVGIHLVVVMLVGLIHQLLLLLSL
jgi:hypothetical protein